MRTAEILNDINNTISNPSNWLIGITDDLNQSQKDHKQEYGSTPSWKVWEADSEYDAKDIEKICSDRGIQKSTKTKERAKFVYLFLAN